MESAHLAQALIDYVRITGLSASVLDAVFASLYRADITLRDEDRIWVLTTVLRELKRETIGESVDIVEQACEKMYTLVRTSRQFPEASPVVEGIAGLADKLMQLVEAARKQYDVQPKSTE